MSSLNELVLVVVIRDVIKDFLAVVDGFGEAVFADVVLVVGGDI